MTAAAGLPIVVVAVLVGGPLFAFAAGTVALLASTEFVHGWLMPSRPIREAARLVAGFAPAAIIVTGSYWSGTYVWTAMVVAAIFAGLSYLPAARVGPRKPFRVQAGALIYCGVLLSTLVLTRGLEDGRSWTLIGLLATFATDSGAYATGRAIGRHKLAPAISPKKTWEGAIGGYVAGVAAVLGLNAAFSTNASTATVLPLALVIPVVSQAGDLFESWMKRRMGVKDASGLLPGHGGFLDRLDSILFVFPVLYLFVRWRVA
ncbi:MAG: phosphatidate cytidylyltransferase [Dehalococcoidia bacterium]